MYILGINFSSHDTSACLLKDGKIVGFIEEERLNRIKHTSEFPSMAIASLLKSEGITMDQVGYVAIPTTHTVSLLTQFKFSFSFGLKGLFLVVMNLKYRLKYKRNLERFKHRINPGKTKLVFVEHHTAHIANAFLASPFQESAIFSVDNNGDGLTSRLAVGRGTDIKNLGYFSLPQSIGLVYYLVTQHLGFAEEGGEGKVMGLASYGNPDKYIDVFRDIIKLKPNGSYSINTKYFRVKPSGFFSGSLETSDLFASRLGVPRKKDQPITKEHEDVAAALQKMTEESVFHVLRELYQKTKVPNLCISGGVALNSVMNGKIHRETPFKNIFIQPLAYDGGNSIGAAFYTWNIVLGKPRSFMFDSCYLGPEFSEEQIMKVIEESKLSYEKISNPAKAAAELIAEGKIIGWFQGKMEAGARALGNRSILADPRRAEMKDIVNKQVKHREPFRPFAPAILEERVSEYFEDSIPVPFMERVFAIRPEKQKLIPAVTHVDGTGRLQTVRRDSNPLYYDIIKTFENITGVPVILNTSFNIKGEPIVCSPIDAIKCFYSTGLDSLIIGNILLKK